MQWIKANVHIVVCSLLSVAGIALLVLGMMDTEVADAMEADARKVSGLRGVDAVSRTMIEAEQRKLRDTKRRVEETLSKIGEIGSFEPLLPGVFPEPENRGAIYDFKRAYAAQFEEFLTRLKAADQPTQEEIQAMGKRMEEARRRAEAQLEFGQTSKGPDQAGTGFPDRSPLDATYGRNRTGAQASRELTPEQLVQEEPGPRLSVLTAHQIQCYAHLDSFDRWVNEVLATSDPSIEDMWAAQVSLWIQEDVVEALARLNDRVAEKLVAEGRKAWVGTLPVKHLVGIWFEEHDSGQRQSRGPRGRGSSRAGSPSSGSPAPAATGSPNHDVHRFSVTLVCEARMLPTIIDEICRNGFYTVELVNYEAVTNPENLVGYIYGSEPSIEVTLDIKGTLLRSKYEEWIPEAVKRGPATSGQPQEAQRGGPRGRPGGLPRGLPPGIGGERE